MSASVFEFASHGSAAAARTVVVLREGALATTDPDPHVTRRHDVRVVAVRVDQAEVAEPGAFGGETPAAVTVAALVKLVTEAAAGDRLSVVGVSGAALVAVHLAAALSDGVDRLALVAAPPPEDGLEREAAEHVLASVTADTLVLDGRRDPDAAAAAAHWHEQHLAHVRIVLLPASERTDHRLALSDVWERVLAHTVPESGS